MSRGDSRDGSLLIFGAVPRASLMPPEVALRRKEAGRRRGLIVGVVTVILAVAAGVAGSFVYAAQAEARVEAERQVTNELLATQLKFAEIVQTRAQLENIRGIRERLSQTEVLWLPTVGPYLAVLSSGEVLEAITVTATDPNGPVLGLADPLRSPRVATVTLTIATSLVPEPQRWLRSWERLDTYSDASVDSIVEDDEEFLTTLTINLDRDALANRVSETETQG